MVLHPLLRFAGGRAFLYPGRMTTTEVSGAERTEIELLARGKAQKSRAMKTRGLPETPEAAHALLLRLGLWQDTTNPYPDRAGISLTPVTLDLPPPPNETRTDLTALPALAIDDDGNRDPDDALSLETLPDGTRRLWVHVADVAALIPPDSPLDLEARVRGATLYLPERTVGMLPDALVEQLGLGLHPESPALSIAVDFEPGPEWLPGVVDVQLTTVRVERLSYREAQRRLDAHDPLLTDLWALAQAQRSYRLSEGAAVIELPEARVKVDADHITVERLTPLDTRVIVQECMMLAGWAAAVWAEDAQLPLPFATQDAPHRQVPGDDLPAHWARRKTLARTRFQPSGGPHRGLGLDLYAQATSPMRRYLDLVVHQQLRAELRGQPTLSGRDIAARTAEAEMNAGGTRSAERLSRRHWTLVQLTRQPERQYEAVVVERRGPQATLLIPELALDAPLTTPHPLGTVLTVQATDVDLPTLSVRLREVQT